MFVLWIYDRAWSLFKWICSGNGELFLFLSTIKAARGWRCLHLSFRPWKKLKGSSITVVLSRDLYETLLIYAISIVSRRYCCLCNSRRTQGVERHFLITHCTNFPIVKAVKFNAWKSYQLLNMCGITHRFSLQVSRTWKTCTGLKLHSHVQTKRPCWLPSHS
jgi:hypothetical protein